MRARVKIKCCTRMEKRMVLPATVHLEQPHERRHGLILVRPTFRPQRAHLGVVEAGRLGKPCRLKSL